MKRKYTTLIELVEIFDQLDDEAKEDVLNHARQVVQKQEKEQAITARKKALSSRKDKGFNRRD